MNKNNKKGFTLVELLAVVLIIGILLILTIIVVNRQVKKADYKAAKVNADIYIKEVNNTASVSRLENNTFSNGKYDVSDLIEFGAKVNGTMPDGGYLVLDNYKVVSGCLTYGKLHVNVNSGQADAAQKGKCEAFEAAVYNFDATPRAPQEFTAPVAGFYKLEVWGAQGGNAGSASGGNGGYATMIVKLNRNQTLYVVVGTQGQSSSSPDGQVYAGGYNGGGSAHNDSGTAWGGGGGATHIGTTATTLANTRVENIIIAAGGGGGAGSFNGYNRTGGAGGGCNGGYGYGVMYGYPGTQTAGGIGKGAGSYHDDGKYGQGGNAGSIYGSGGGGGYYGGGTGYDSGSSGGGGSGYINLNFRGAKKAEFYSSTYVSCNVNNVNTWSSGSDPISGYNKTGDGYARITQQ